MLASRAFSSAHLPAAPPRTPLGVPAFGWLAAPTPLSSGSGVIPETSSLEEKGGEPSQACEAAAGLPMRSRSDAGPSFGKGCQLCR